MTVIEGVIFDLDGVLIHTDDLHRIAWSELAIREGWVLDSSVADSLRGVSRGDSLDLIAAANGATVDPARHTTLTDAKDARYRELLQCLNHDSVAPEVRQALADLRAQGLRLAIGSSSRNAGTILARTGLLEAFDAIVDGTMIARSKPDPEVFTLAARRLGLAPQQCAVVEDAVAGIAAAGAAGCYAISVTDEAAGAADVRIEGLGALSSALKAVTS